MSKKVAFTFIGGKDWLGGYNYLKNLFAVILEYANNQITPVLFVGNDYDTELIEPLREMFGIKIVVSPVFNEKNRNQILIKSLLMGFDNHVVKIFKHEAIDVVFETGIFLGSRFPLPTIAWIPDLQHKVYPELFSFKSKLRRDFGFKQQLKNGRFIMVSSDDCKNDLVKFYNHPANKINVVRFAILMRNTLDRANQSSIKKKYNLPDDYFFLPNQFWKHKNHVIVIEALNILKSEGIQRTVIASGQQSDPRNSSHVPYLKDLVKKYKLEDNFIIPGIIPYTDLLLLMEAAQAVINPSFFEGWSTTVEEAKSLGVPLLLSDIRVHKEQASELAYFFNPNSPRELASVLKSFNRPETFRESTDNALKNKQRLQDYADNFVNLVKLAGR